LLLTIANFALGVTLLKIPFAFIVVCNKIG